MTDAITKVLQGIEDPGSFAARHTGPADDLRLEVKGVGPLRFPLSKAAAKRLIAVARKAPYGLQDKTLMDPSVRDCWMVARSRLKVDLRRWKKTLDPALERFQGELGLHPEGRLRAELYNLLVYEPVQFFKAHQDSERADDMIGTLVVTLPSSYRGGTCIIEHNGQRVSYRASKRPLSLVSFYADCHHEVRPVSAGYRVVLIYNLYFEAPTACRAASAAVALSPRRRRALSAALQTHFETPRPPRWSGDEPKPPPDRLVYLLDHQYSQRSLTFQSLKRRDASRVAVLTAAAEALDCEVALALADVHESWSCEDDYDGYRGRGRRWGRYGRYDDDDEDDEPDKNVEDFELVELIDRDVELRHFRRPGGKRVPNAQSSVGEIELCCTRESSELEPFHSEHEGYMGNYGNTVDRWYHRAALVLWPRDRSFVIQARASPRWAIEALAKLLRAGRHEEARRQVAALEPFWSWTAAREDSRGFVESSLQVAQALDDAGLARLLVTPFKLERLNLRAARLLLGLLDSYGLSWCQELLAPASRHRAGRSKTARPARLAELAWLARLARFCAVLFKGAAATKGAESGNGARLARWLVRLQWTALSERYLSLRERLPSRNAVQELKRLSPATLHLLEAAAVSADEALPSEIATLLLSGFEAAPAELDLLVDLLGRARRRHEREALVELGLAPLFERVEAALEARLDAAERAPDDWSVPTLPTCDCSLCGTLSAFLSAPDQHQLDWPLAKDGRSHIHRTIDDIGLPLRHDTRRQGRPYTLVLEKTDALFAQERAQRQRWHKALASLRK